MPYEYGNAVIPLGDDLAERMEAKVGAWEDNGWEFQGCYALPDAGGLVLRFRRLKYRPGVLS